MNLLVFLPLPEQITSYLKELQSSLQAKFSLETELPKEIELLQIPIKSTSKKVVETILNKYLDGLIFKIRIYAPHNTEQISHSNDKIEIPIDEKSWNRVVDFQGSLLKALQQHIDTTRPIVTKSDTHHSDRPREYVNKFGTDNVLNWYGGGVFLTRVKNFEKRKEILQYISEKRPLDFKIKDKPKYHIS